MPTYFGDIIARLGMHLGKRHQQTVRKTSQAIKACGVFICDTLGKYT